MKLDLKELISKLTNTPIIIEQGTSGIWKYRKWSNGIAECWGKWSGSLTHYMTYGSFYCYNTGALNYPTDLFVEEPSTHYSGRIGGGFCLTGTLFGATKDAMSCYAMSSAGGSQSCEFFIYSIGRWK